MHIPGNHPLNKKNAEREMFKTVCAWAFMGLLSGTAFAQQAKVDEMKRQGAVPLNAAELEALLKGATLQYTQPGSDIEVTLSPDGGISGSTVMTQGQNQGRSFGLSGSWNINENGRWCGKQMSTVRGAKETTYCRVVWKRGDQLFWSANAAGNATAFPFTVRK